MSNTADLYCPPVLLAAAGAAQPRVDPHYANIGLLLQGDDFQPYIDKGPNNLSVTGRMIRGPGLWQVEAPSRYPGGRSLTFTADTAPHHGYLRYDAAQFANDAIKGKLRLSGTWTFEAWVYLPAQLQAADEYVGCWRDGDQIGALPSANGWIGLHKDGSGNAVVRVQQGTAPGVSTVATGAITIGLGAWHHIAVVGASYDLRIFVDGVQDGAIRQQGVALGTWNPGSYFCVGGDY